MKAFLPMECQCNPTARRQNIGREQKGTKSIKILVFYGQVSLRFSEMRKSRTRWLKFELSSSLFRLSQLMPSCLLGSSNAKSGGRKERERVRVLRTNTFILWKQLMRQVEEEDEMPNKTWKCLDDCKILPFYLLRERTSYGCVQIFFSCLRGKKATF